MSNKFNYVADYNILGKESRSGDPLERGIPVLEKIERRFSAESDAVARKSSTVYRDSLRLFAQELYGDQFGGVSAPEIRRLEKVIDG